MTYDLLGWALLVSAFGLVVLGLVLGYQAYRGFRRNDSRPMQFLSIGLILLTAVAYSLAFVGTLLLRQGVVPLQYQRPLTLLVRIIQFVGLGLITYSLYRRP
jgi:hypothetical protein